MTIGIKLLTKVLSNGIEQHTKIITYHEWRGFIPGMQSWVHIWKSVYVNHHINGLEKKSKMIIINWCRKSTWKNLSLKHGISKDGEERNFKNLPFHKSNKNLAKATFPELWKLTKSLQWQGECNRKRKTEKTNKNQVKSQWEKKLCGILTDLGSVPPSQAQW